MRGAKISSSVPFYMDAFMSTAQHSLPKHSIRSHSHSHCSLRFIYGEHLCRRILGRIVYHTYVCLCWRLRRHIRNEMRKAEKLCRQPREVTISRFPFSPFFHGPVIVLSALSSEFVGLLRIFGARKYIKLFSLINLSWCTDGISMCGDGS